MEKDSNHGLLYLTISKILKQEMEDGRIKPGEQLPGVRVLAGRFETSGKTISRVLDELEVSGFIERTQGRGIFALPLQERTGGRAGAWGCLCPAGDEEAERIVLALQEAAGAEGREMLLRTYNAIEDDCSRLPAIMYEKGAAGLFWAASSFPPGIASVSGLPLLLLGGSGGPSGTHSILWDLSGGLDSCVEHLSLGGHLDIGFIEETPGRGGGFPFFEAAMKRRSLGVVKTRCLAVPPDAGEVSLAVRKLLKRDAEVTALVCMSDRLALGAIRGASEAGLSVPEDLCVTGFGGTTLAEASVPGLTTLASSPRGMAESAAACMQYLIEKKGNSKTVLRLYSPLDLVLRDSSVNSDNDYDERWV